MTWSCCSGRGMKAGMQESMDKLEQVAKSLL
jgi:hypothetical protein